MVFGKAGASRFAGFWGGLFPEEIASRFPYADLPKAHPEAKIPDANPSDVAVPHTPTTTTPVELCVDAVPQTSDLGVKAGID